MKPIRQLCLSLFFGTALHLDFDPEQQQYVVLCMNDLRHPATYTGTKTNAYGGTLVGYGISLQGITLTLPDEIQAIFDAAIKAQKDSFPIQEVLMLALGAGAKAGAIKGVVNEKHPALSSPYQNQTTWKSTG